MTLFVDSVGDGQVKVNCTYGPITFSVVEEVSSARAFWSQLGRVLHSTEERAREGYERYRTSSGGVSKFTGDELPAFDEQDEDIRNHWIAAFSE